MCFDINLDKSILLRYLYPVISYAIADMYSFTLERPLRFEKTRKTKELADFVNCVLLWAKAEDRLC